MTDYTKYHDIDFDEVREAVNDLLDKESDPERREVRWGFRAAVEQPVLTDVVLVAVFDDDERWAVFSTEESFARVRGLLEISTGALGPSARPRVTT